MQGLDLGFLVHTQDHGPLRGDQIQPEDVAGFIHEERVRREFEGLGPVRWSPKARQMRLTAVWDIPSVRAIERVDQWVAAGGVSSRVLVMTASTCASVMRRGAPDRGASVRPWRRAVTNRWRHWPTMGRLTPSSAAMA
jgi:hypothetical protein